MSVSDAKNRPECCVGALFLQDVLQAGFGDDMDSDKVPKNISGECAAERHEERTRKEAGMRGSEDEGGDDDIFPQEKSAEKNHTIPVFWWNVRDELDETGVHFYLYRRASRVSMCEALRAGKTPVMKPTKAPKAMTVMINQSGL